jgi:hypothetical protein
MAGIEKRAHPIQSIETEIAPSPHDNSWFPCTDSEFGQMVFEFICSCIDPLIGLAKVTNVLTIARSVAILQPLANARGCPSVLTVVIGDCSQGISRLR